RRNAQMSRASDEAVQQAQLLKLKAEKLEKDNLALRQRVEKAEKQNPVVDSIVVRGGVGPAMISFKNSGTQASPTEPAILVEAKSPRILLGLRVSGSFKYAIPTGTSGIAFSDVLAKIGPQVSLGKTSNLDLFVGFESMGEDYDLAGVSFRHSNLALGL